MKEKLVNAYSWIQAMYKSEKGQGMVEYALILAFIVVVAAALTTDGGLKEAISGVFGKATTQINSGN